MLSKQEIYEQDARQIAECTSIEWDALRNSRVFLTGATGLIGYTILSGIMAYNRIFQGNIYVTALVRNMDKAKQMLGKWLEQGFLELHEGDVLTPVSVDADIDYIIHGASETASKAFVERPVETIQTAIYGTENMLKLAREKQVKGMVYMSSMEVYGTPDGEELLNEESMGYLNPLAVRSSYSESKQMVENLCAAYQSEYGVPVKIVRLTQTFGPGVTRADGRVFAQFARAAVAGENISLQTKGETKRMYLYTADAATALLTILTSGVPGQAYNAARSDSYCSIYEMAELVAGRFGGGKSEVLIEIPDTPNTSYNPVMCVNLDVSRLEALGWRAVTDLTSMYERMIVCME